MTEHDTQNAIIELVRMMGGIATRVNSGTMINKGADGRTYAVKMADKGTSDILCCYQGRYIAIEVKHGKNKATAAQLEFGERVRDAGGIFVIAYSVDDVLALLERL